MRSAFVTGASQGLGYGFVDYLLGEGWQVFGTVRDVHAKLPRRDHLFWIPIELQNDESIHQATEEVRKHTSTIDLLINCAGINKDTIGKDQKEKVTQLRMLDRELLLKMFEVNAIAPMMVLQKMLPLLSPDPAFVINISSCRASFHDQEASSYANYGYRASKAALNIFTLCSAFDLPRNVRTFSVHPGIVRTSMNPSGTMDPKEQAGKIINITKKWDETKNGLFLNYDGTPYPL